jgi:hypothetical protein
MNSYLVTQLLYVGRHHRLDSYTNPSSRYSDINQLSHGILNRIMASAQQFVEEERQAVTQPCVP